MGIALLAVTTDNVAVVELVLHQEAFGVVVAVDVDLGECIVRGRLFNAFMDTGLQPWQEELQSGGRGEGTKGGLMSSVGSWLYLEW